MLMCNIILLHENNIMELSHMIAPLIVHHKNLTPTPYKLGVGVSQKAWTILIWGLQDDYGVK